MELSKVNKIFSVGYAHKVIPLFLEIKSASYNKYFLSIYLKSNKKYYQMNVDISSSYRYNSVTVSVEESNDFSFANGPAPYSGYYLFKDDQLKLNTAVEYKSGVRMGGRCEKTNLFAISDEYFGLTTAVKPCYIFEIPEITKDENITNIFNQGELKKLSDYMKNIIDKAV